MTPESWILLGLKILAVLVVLGFLSQWFINYIAVAGMSIMRHGPDDFKSQVGFAFRETGFWLILSLLLTLFGFYEDYKESKPDRPKNFY